MEAFNRGVKASSSDLIKMRNAKCRYGINTNGHLWKLGRIIDTARFRLPLPEAKNRHCAAAEDEQRCLSHLATELRRLGETTLAMHTERFLDFHLPTQEDVPIRQSHT
jgi:hypothetical protein